MPDTVGYDRVEEIRAATKQSAVHADRMSEAVDLLAHIDEQRVALRNLASVALNLGARGDDTDLLRARALLPPEEVKK